MPTVVDTPSVFVKMGQTKRIVKRPQPRKDRIGKAAHTSKKKNTASTAKKRQHTGGGQTDGTGTLSGDGLIPCSEKSDAPSSSAYSMSTLAPPTTAAMRRIQRRLKENEEIRFENAGPPPEGYVFVPKGDVYITKNCRLRTHESGQTVYVVCTASKTTQLGLYVPHDIHALVATAARKTSATRQAAVATKDARDTRTARTLLEHEFPRMPEEDVRRVLAHAFRKGSRRVGRCGKTKVRDEQTKVRLAVEAHIRHVHTDYDALLTRGMEKHVAREVVWERVKGVKASWEKEGK